MKQFDFKNKVFDWVTLDGQGVPQLNGDGWYLVETQEELNKISETITGSGVVWVEAGRLKCSGRRPSPAHHWADGEWQLDEAAAAAQAAVELTAAKADKLKAANAAAQAFINQHAGIDAVPEFEFASWTIQAAEAKAWQADPSAATPVLNGIAAARGIAPELLKAAALRKTIAYEALTAHVAGQRQALQSKIEAAKSQAALDKIEIAFTLPEAV